MHTSPAVSRTRNSSPRPLSPPPLKSTSIVGYEHDEKKFTRDAVGSTAPSASAVGRHINDYNDAGVGSGRSFYRNLQRTRMVLEAVCGSQDDDATSSNYVLLSLATTACPGRPSSAGVFLGSSSAPLRAGVASGTVLNMDLFASSPPGVIPPSQQLRPVR
ncbi:unnamed protein product [Agarophyton chilense]